MVAWKLPSGLADLLALTGDDAEDADDLHLTLAFFPDYDNLEIPAVAAAMEAVSTAFRPLVGEFNGLGRFSIEDGDALVALADVPGLGRLRESLCWELEQRGVAYADNHGFSPHVTLAYIPTTQVIPPVTRFEPTPIIIDTISLFGAGGEIGTILLGGTKARKFRFGQQRNEAERRFQGAVKRALGKVGTAVWARLRREAKALDDILDDERFWGLQAEEIAREIGSLPLSMMMEGAGQASAYGLTVDMKLVNAVVSGSIPEYTTQWIDALNSATRDALRGAIQTWVDTGAPKSDLRAAIEPLFGAERAERIAVTEVTRLYAEGNRQAYAAVGISRVRWNTANDDRVDDDCEELDGRIMVLGEEDAVPPLHVNCRCWLSPEGEPEIQAESEPETELEAAIVAKEDEIVTGGFETGVVWDRDGELWIERAGTIDSVEFKTEELQYMRGATLTHNHPSGNSFSHHDIALAATHGLEEMRVVGAEYRYSMRAPEGQPWPSWGTMGGDGNALISGPLRDAYVEIEAAVRGEFWGAIGRGEMKIAEAEARHWHEIWTRVSDRLGLRYERTERT